MVSTDVLIIGGSASGLATALSGKTNNPDKEFLLVRKEEKVMVPCGIPYMFGSLDSTDQNVMPTDTSYDKLGVKHMIGTVEKIDKKRKVCILSEGTEISYEKLVIATGSKPKKPDWLEGKDLKHVYTIPKNDVYLDKMKDEIGCCKKILVIGAGFIGVEFSDELRKSDNDVTIVEVMPRILSQAFGQTLSEKAENLLKERGVNVETGVGIKRINGEEKVTGVELEDGRTIDADAVVLAMGYEPNSKLAEEAGIRMAKDGFISVDEYMRTDQPDVFAVGDAAEKRDFVTRKQTGIMLASTACAEGRIAGMNLYKLSALKTFSGTIAIYSTVVGDNAFGTAGLCESLAQSEGFDVVTGYFEGMDKHPGSLPNAHSQAVKLIVARESGIIIGGEVFGGVTAGEVTNLIGFIIQTKVNVHTLLTAQIGTHPMLTASPAAYPLIKAAENAVQKMRGQL